MLGVTKIKTKTTFHEPGMLRYFFTHNNCLKPRNNKTDEDVMRGENEL